MITQLKIAETVNALASLKEVLNILKDKERNESVLWETLTEEDKEDWHREMIKIRDGLNLQIYEFRKSIKGSFLTE